jgi:hypothetical protein
VLYCSIFGAKFHPDGTANFSVGFADKVQRLAANVTSTSDEMPSATGSGTQLPVSGSATPSPTPTNSAAGAGNFKGLGSAVVSLFVMVAAFMTVVV